jgi:hypothetical protein
MNNPKAWDTITGFTANVKAAIERLNKLADYLRENKQQLTEAAAQIEAVCNATMKSILTEAPAVSRGRWATPGEPHPGAPIVFSDLSRRTER